MTERERGGRCARQGEERENPTTISYQQQQQKRSNARSLQKGSGWVSALRSEQKLPFLFLLSSCEGFDWSVGGLCNLFRGREMRGKWNKHTRREAKKKKEDSKRRDN